jgi:hypothetical protein
MQQLLSCTPCRIGTLPMCLNVLHAYTSTSMTANYYLSWHAKSFPSTGDMPCLPCRYGIAFWYGAKLVREDGNYDGGVVLTIVFGAIIGGFSLGQAAPNFEAFGMGRSAGGRIMAMIERVPSVDADAPGKILSDGLKVSSTCCRQPP